MDFFVHCIEKYPKRFYGFTMANFACPANEGLRFTRFYNAARCWPTRSLIMSGYYPQQVNNDGRRDDYPLWAHLLPHHLKKAGYRNYHSGKWHIINVEEVIGEAGFDRSYHTGAYDNALKDWEIRKKVSTHASYWY